MSLIHNAVWLKLIVGGRSATRRCLLVLLRSRLAVVTGDTRPPLRPARPIRRGCPSHVADTTWMWHPRRIVWYGRFRPWDLWSKCGRTRPHAGNEHLVRVHIYALTGILDHARDLAGDRHAAFSTV